MRFKYTILYVSNVKEAMEFYVQAFGFEQLFIHEGEDYGELITGETTLAFAATELQKQLGRNPLAANADNPSFELAFESDDVKTDLKRALDAGARLIQKEQVESWGQTTSYVSDPNGFLIEICSPVQLPNPG